MPGYQCSQQQQNYMWPSQMAHQTPLYQPKKPSPEPFLVNTEWEEMKVALKAIQDNSSKKLFKFDELCPYPFYNSITSCHFPKHFGMPKFTKYQEKGGPHHHIKEFYMACQEVAYCDNYLLQLFPKSLSGSSLEWFSKLPFGVITTFVDLSKWFVAHYHYNVEKGNSIVWSLSS